MTEKTELLSDCISAAISRASKWGSVEVSYDWLSELHDRVLELEGNNKVAPLKVVKIVETCGGCPSQWDAWTDAGVYLYIRYRHGRLTISKEEGDTRDTVFSTSHGDPMDGCMSLSELQEVAASALDLSAVN